MCTDVGYFGSYLFGSSYAVIYFDLCGSGERGGSDSDAGTTLDRLQRAKPATTATTAELIYMHPRYNKGGEVGADSL